MTEFDDLVLAEMERLNKRGFATCWVLPNEKCPKVKEWNRQSMPRSLHAPGSNLGTQGGALSGDLVILDFDRPDICEYAEKFLPHTPMKDGRSSKPNAHWYFRVKNIPPEFRAGEHVAGGLGGPRIRHFGDCKTDLIGTGGMVVCPPSRHPSGEVRAWVDPDAEPLEIDFMELWEPFREVMIEYGWVDLLQDAVRHAKKTYRAKSGQSGHNTTFAAMSALVCGYGLDGEDAEAAAFAWNETNAEPKWSAEELHHKLDGATQAAGKDPRFPIGYLIKDGRSANDPTRLADGFPGVWKCYGGAMFKYEAGRYRMVPDGEVHHEIRRYVDGAFGKAHARAMYAWEKSGGKGKQPGRQQVSRGITSEVLASLQMRRVVPSNFEMPCQLPGGERPQRLSLRNGLLNPETLELLPHDPNWLSTVRLDYDYDPNTTEPRLEGWLRSWFGDDHELIAVAQEWGGYSLTRTSVAQSFLMLCGPGGNGKGALTALYEALVGRENCSYQSWNDWGERFGLGPTMGKLLNIADEASEFDKTVEGRIKWYTAGKPISFEFKGQAIINAVPTARLVVACNTPPRISDRTEGIWRRMILLPFAQTIPHDKRIPGLDDSAWWTANVNMAGVLNWALEGLSRLRANNWRFTQSAAAAHAKEVLREECNPATSFLREHVVADETGKDIASTALFDTYREWCARGNYFALNINNFGSEVKRMFPGVETRPRRLRGKLDRYWFGVTRRGSGGDEVTQPAIDWSGIWDFARRFGEKPIQVSTPLWRDEDEVTEEDV